MPSWPRDRLHFPVRKIAYAAAGLAVGALTGWTAWRIQQSIALARASEPLQQAPAGARTRMLILGDSTAVGTGATRPQGSVAGRIAADHPRLKIVNRGANGARFADIVAQLELEGERRYDVILIQGGGNDVIRLTGKKALEHSITRLAALARRRAATAIFMPSGNIGNAPFFLAPFSWWMTRRSRALHAIVRRVAGREGAIYVNLFKERADDPFAQDPQRLHAADHLHPSDAGYELWYAALVEQSELASRLDRT